MGKGYHFCAATHGADSERIDDRLAHPLLINRPIVITPCGREVVPPERVLDDGHGRKRGHPRFVVCEDMAIVVRWKKLRSQS
jgi:hypothetical protein